MTERIENGIRYREIEDFPGYFVGEDGSVWTTYSTSWEFCGGATPGHPAGHKRSAWKRKAVKEINSGYLVVKLTKNGKHLNGNRHDNRLLNLCWGTQKENEKDKIAHGTKAIGERHGGAKLNEQQVEEIRRLLAEGKMSQEAIGAAFGVCQPSVSDIKRGKLWAHMKT